MNGVELGVTNVRTALHGPKAAPLAQYLNLWSVEDGVLAGVNLDYSTVYELEPENAFLMEPSRFELFNAQAGAFLNSLPPGAVLQFLVQIRKGDRETLRDYKAAALGGSGADAHDASVKGAGVLDAWPRSIIEKKCEAMANKFTQRRRHFLFATSRPMGGKAPMTWLMPVFRRPLKDRAADFHRQRLREHEALERIVSERLGTMGVKFRKLDAPETLGLIFEHLNPGRERQDRPGLKSLSPLRTLREQAALSPLREEFDYVQVNDRWLRGVSLLRLPEGSHPAYTQRVLNALWPDCDFVLTVHALDTEKAISSLKLKNNITRTLAFSAWTKNYEAEQKHLELDELITEIRASAQRLFRFSMSVLVRGKSLDELRDKTGPVLSAFRDFASAEGASDDMNHFRLFLQSIPGHAELNDRKFYAQTDALAGFLPLSGTWRGSKDKKMLLETPMGELFCLDPFDPELPAKHGLVLGTTGSGKSFTVNYLLNNFIISSPDNHVVVIDVGGSYRKMAKAFGGEYLEVTLSERYGFNPFPLRSRLAPGGVYDDDAVAYLSLLISRMCVSAGKTVSVKEQGFLERAIKNAYAQKEEVVLSDVREELYRLASERPAAKDYADSLELWTTGMYGRLFNRPGNLNVDNRLVVFDLQNLENHASLQAVYFFVIRSILWSKLQDRKLRKMIVIDEGWKFFNDETGSELIQNLYRTARKFNGAIFSVSQSPKDFLDTKAASAIVGNSYVKYVLKLTKGHELLSQFDLNPNEIEAVKSLESKPGLFSDIFVKFGTHPLVARIEPGDLDYCICTTDANDYIKENRLREKNPGLSEQELLIKLSALRAAGDMPARGTAERNRS